MEKTILKKITSCAICDAENSVKEGVCEKCDYCFRDTDS